MVATGRKRSIAFFIAHGAGLVAVLILLYIGWVLLNWRSGVLLFLGIVLLLCVIAGVVLNTIFLVREIRRNEQHDAFINAVTHELKTPVASIRLYLETLQRREVSEALILGDASLTITEGVILPWGEPDGSSVLLIGTYHSPGRALRS